MELAPMGKMKVTALVRKPGEATDVELVYELTMPAPPLPTPSPSPLTAASAPPSATPSQAPTSTPSSVTAGPAGSPASAAGGGDPPALPLALVGLLALAAIAWGIRARARPR